MRTQTLKCVNNCESCLNSFFAISLQLMNIYCSMDATVILYVYMVSNCCLSLYLNIAGLRQGFGKCFSSPGKVLEFFVTMSGNPV